MRFKTAISFFLTLILLLGGQAFSAPPHPSLWQKMTKGLPATSAGSSGLNSADSLGKAQSSSSSTGLQTIYQDPSNILVKHRNSPQFAPYRGPKRAIKTTGNIKVVVIPLEFDDISISSAQLDKMEELLFASDKPSAYTYFLENSYGKMKFQEGEISPKVKSEKTMAYYGADASGIDDKNGDIWKMAEEAAILADAHIDYGDYATLQGDIYVVDHLIVMHAGGAQEFDNEYDCIWSHRWFIGGDGAAGYKTNDTKDGKFVYIKNYSTFSADSPLGIIVHEFAHELGLPDLYNTQSWNDNGIGDWGLMSTGCWLGGSNRDGSNPCHLSPWSKLKLGWINPVDITGDRNGGSSFSINSFAGATDPDDPEKPVCYRIKLGSDKEYFLLSNRQKTKFDADLPGSGLLIWHCDDNMQDNDNSYHRVADIVRAGGGDIFSRGSSDDPFYEGNQDSFTPQTIPSALSYDKNWMVAIEEISKSKALMTFKNKLALYLGIFVHPADSDLVMINIKPNYPVASLSNLTVSAIEDGDSTLINMNKISDGTILLGSYRPVGEGYVKISVHDSVKDISGTTDTLDSTTTVATLSFSSYSGQNARGKKLMCPDGKIGLYIPENATLPDGRITMMPVDIDENPASFASGTPLASGATKGAIAMPRNSGISADTGAISGKRAPSRSGASTAQPLWDQLALVGSAYNVGNSKLLAPRGITITGDNIKKNQGLGTYKDNRWQWLSPEYGLEFGIYGILQDDMPPIISHRFNDDYLVATVMDSGSGLDKEPWLFVNGRELNPAHSLGDDYYFAMPFGGEKGQIMAVDRAGNRSDQPVWAPSFAAGIFDFVQVAPNPGVEEINFRFKIKGLAQKVRLAIYDNAGERVASFADNNTDEGDFIWYLEDEYGYPVANGVYFWKLQIFSSNGTKVRKGKAAVLR